MNIIRTECRHIDRKIGWRPCPLDLITHHRLLGWEVRELVDKAEADAEIAALRAQLATSLQREKDLEYQLADSLMIARVVAETPTIKDGLTVQGTSDALASAPVERPLSVLERTAPERIWLQIGEEKHHHDKAFPSNVEDITWCHSHQLDGEVAYVRADLAAASPQGGAVPSDTPTQATYVECRECDECNHVGINDSHNVDAACSFCDWHGESPDEDKCPSCGRDGAMMAACPKCSGEYNLLCEADISHPPATPAAPDDAPLPTMSQFASKADYDAAVAAAPVTQGELPGLPKLPRGEMGHAWMCSQVTDYASKYGQQCYDAGMAYARAAIAAQQGAGEQGLAAAVVINQKLGKYIAANKPALMLLNHEELAALRRFNETCEDGQEYDVEKDMMCRLAAIGVIEAKRSKSYQFTDFGNFVIERSSTIERGAALQAKDGAQGEAVAWMWQHEETGRIGFVDSWQVENGWQKGNPRLQLIRPLYTKPQPADATTLAEAALYRDMSVQSVQMGYDGLADAMEDLCKRRSQPADAGAARLTDQAIVDVYHKEFSQTVRSQDEAFIHRFARAIEAHITGGKP